MKLGSTFPEVAIIQVENYDHGAAPMGVHVLEWVCVSHVQNADVSQKSDVWVAVAADVLFFSGPNPRCSLWSIRRLEQWHSPANYQLHIRVRARHLRCR